jgi:hypothetical protein
VVNAKILGAGAGAGVSVTLLPRVNTMRIREQNDEDGLFLRDGLVVAFFCKQPGAELMPRLARVLEGWLDRVPPQSKRWGLIGASSETFKPWTAQLEKRVKAQLDPSQLKSSMFALELGGPEKSNPAYCFLSVGSKQPPADKPKTSVLELRFPSEFADADHVEEAVTYIRSVAETLPYDSGYASLALLCVQAQEFAFSRAAAPLVRRHPGFDVPGNDGKRIFLDRQLPGAYWLTFIGPTSLGKLGGAEALRGALDPAIALEPVGAGIMLRAGPLPELGDIERGEKLPLLRNMAQVLAPATQSGTKILNHLFPDEASRERWERRYFD